jgi:hypothetical protein
MIGVPIDFDDERDLARQEVNDVLADDLLSPKGDSQALSANGGPKQLFRKRGVMTHEASPLFEESATSN